MDKFVYIIFTKGHLISKANCQNVNSSKKWMNEFVFTSMQCVFAHFLKEIEDSKKVFQNNSTFRKIFLKYVNLLYTCNFKNI